MRICFATHNKNKVNEIKKLISSEYTILTLDDLNEKKEIEETEETLEGNAFLKAEYIFNKYNIPTFADDSGLEVTALGGKPGVYSARYAGIKKNDKDNINLLLKNLKGKQDRSAQFKTVIAFIDNNNQKLFQGITKGHIIEKPRGTKGFGYDSVFIPDQFLIDDIQKTFAEIDIENKNKLSSRSKAVNKFVLFLNIMN
ncbi:MAG: RdgB/HAM1 family non-canonical purine NTP pyrophosphatase [Bacteroidetes bacterium]|nr:RdgB/HAM1 family non-canonical purine NTP pyrophosphatase [Bacteroidota bacterium]